MLRKLCYFSEKNFPIKMKDYEKKNIFYVAAYNGSGWH